MENATGDETIIKRDEHCIIMWTENEKLVPPK